MLHPSPKRRTAVALRLLVAACGVGAAALSAQDSAPAASRPAVASRPAEDLRIEAAKLFHERRFEELLEKLKPLLVDDPVAADLWIMAAEASLQLEDHALAAARFERGLALRPALASASVNLGLAYLKLDRYDDARAVLRRFERDPRPERAAKARYGLGLAALADGDREAARAAFEAARSLAPDDARPRYRTALLDLEDGKFDLAAEGFRDALELDRLHHGAAYGLSRALKLGGKAAEGARWAKRHVELIDLAESIRRSLRELPRSATPAQTCFDLAALYVCAQDKPKAEFWLARALALDPRHPASVALKPALAAMVVGRP
jgi:tetratricopeptide (TPR) repeat protein